MISFDIKRRLRQGLTLKMTPLKLTLFHLSNDDIG